MLTVEQLRKKAWEHLQSAKTLFSKNKFDNSDHLCGFAVEMMLKAKICVDNNWPDFPANKAEMRSSNKARGFRQDTHDLEILLKKTSVEADIKQSCLSEWSICIEWTPQSRYQRAGNIDQQSAAKLIRSAEKVMRRIASHPGLEGYDPDKLLTMGNAYLKLVVAEHELSDEHGDFSLFGIWRRSDSHPDSVDVVVSAPWIDATTRVGVEFVTNAILAKLPGDEIKSISAVIALDKSHPVVQRVQQLLGLHHGDAHLTQCDLGTFTVEDAFIITSQRL